MPDVPCPPSTIAHRPSCLLRLAGLAFAAVLVVAVAGAYPTQRLAGGDGLKAMAAALGSAVIAFAVALALLSGQIRKGAAAVGPAFLGAGPVRMAVTIGLSLAASWAFGLPRAPLLVWAAVFYLSLLTAEVIWLKRLLRTV